MKIKIHTSIAAGCVKARLAEPYFLWLLAKGVSDGRGWVTMSELKSMYLSIFNNTERTFYNHFNNGKNIFYNVSKDKCFLSSMDKIIKNIDATIKMNACFLIDTETIALHGLKPKQILINCVLGTDKNNKPLSLWYISDALNLDRSTIIRNIDKSLLKTTTNLRIDKSDMRKFWSSYTFIGGHRLLEKKEKRGPSDLIIKSKKNIKLHKK